MTRIGKKRGRFKHVYVYKDYVNVCMTDKLLILLIYAL